MGRLLPFAHFEREVAGERIRDKIAQSKGKSMWTGGAVRLGYDVKARQLIVSESQTEQVRALVVHYAEVRSTGAVVAFAAKQEIRSKRRKTVALVRR